MVGSSKASVSSDIIFSGDLTKWEKFANSLRLRYLLRISSKQDVKAEVAAIASEGKIMDDNSDNAVMLALSAKPNQGYVSMLRYGDYNLWRMTTTMDSIMKELDDPRMSVIFDAAGIDADGNPFYAGFPVGITDGTEATMGVDQNQTSRISEDRFFNNVTAVNYDMMKAAEVQFILAEAALNGMISGDVEDYYNKGIELALADAGAENGVYVYSNNVKYNGAKALNQIITQKWLANFMVGIEGWCEFKRTGYPVLHTNIDNQNIVGGKAEIPSRYYYPADEQVYNKENYNTQVSKMGGEDNINYSLWWEK